MVPNALTILNKAYCKGLPVTQCFDVKKFIEILHPDCYWKLFSEIES